MSFKINPCKSVLSIPGLGVNEISNKCYGICHAFKNPEGCRDQCRELVADIHAKNGKARCSQTRPMPPVNWQQVPRFFPDLLNKTGNVKQAADKCVKMCYNAKQSNECKQMCLLDANSVSEISDEEVIIEVVDTGFNYNNCLLWVFIFIAIAFVVYILRSM